jgi:hypothetical protein
VWLWLTVVFANLAEAFAEGRGRAQADALRSTRHETVAILRDGSTRPAAELTKGDVVVVEAGELIPGDGTVIVLMGAPEQRSAWRRLTSPPLPARLLSELPGVDLRIVADRTQRAPARQP